MLSAPSLLRRARPQQADVRRPSHRTVMIVLVAANLAACISYPPAPVDLAANAERFDARRLDDPALLAWLRAQEPEPPELWPPATWDLDRLAAVALYQSPELQSARARLVEALARASEAEVPPAPGLETDFEHSRNPPSGDKANVYGARLALALDPWGRRRAVADQADRLADAAAADLTDVAWAVRARVRLALAEHLVAVRARELVRRQVETEEQRAAMLAAARDAGAASPWIARAAEADLRARRATAAGAETRVAVTRADLAATLGLPTAALDGIVLVGGDLESPPLPEPSNGPSPSFAIGEAGEPQGLQALVRQARTSRADLRAAVAHLAAAEATLRAADAGQYPELSVAPGFLEDQGQHKLTLGAGATLPVLGGARQAVETARAERDVARADVLALQARIVSQIDTALVRYRAGLAALAAADEALEELDRREGQARVSLQAGATSPVDLLEASRGRLAGEIVRLDALRDAQAALGELEDALHARLGPDGHGPPSAGAL